MANQIIKLLRSGRCADLRRACDVIARDLRLATPRNIGDMPRGYMWHRKQLAYRSTGRLPVVVQGPRAPVRAVKKFARDIASGLLDEIQHLLELHAHVAVDRTQGETRHG